MRWTYCLINGIFWGVMTALAIRDQVRTDVLDYQQLIGSMEP